MRRLLLPLAVLAAGALPAAAAHATTYCVGKPSCAAVPGNLTAATLKAAIAAAAAHAGQDAIELGSGTFPYPGSVPTVAGGNDISAITGMGQGVTHVAEGASGALEVDEPGTVVQDLTIDTIAGSSANAFVLAAAGATARRVTVSGAADDGSAFGLTSGAALDDVTVTVPKVSGGMDGAYVYATGGATITGSSFSAAAGIRVNDIDTTRLRDVKVDALSLPVELDAGTLDADGLLVTPPGGGGDLVSVATGSTATATIRHATLAKATGDTAIDVDAYANAARASVTVRDVVVTGTGGFTFTRTAVAGATASVNVGYSAYDPAATQGVTGLPGPTDLALPADPGFVDAAHGNYALAAGSPLIDRGEPLLPSGGAATDLAGNPRVVGGRTDIGAYEYVPPAPAAADPISAPATTTPAPPVPAGPTPAAPAPVRPVSAPVAARLVLFASARQRLDRLGRFAVAATCDAPLGCKGTLRLTARSGRRTITLGSATVALRNGAARTFHIKLTRAGRALLARHRTLSVSVSASVRDGGGRRLPAGTAFSGRRR